MIKKGLLWKTFIYISSSFKCLKNIYINCVWFAIKNTEESYQVWLNLRMENVSKETKTVTQGIWFKWKTITWLSHNILRLQSEYCKYKNNSFRLAWKSAPIFVRRHYLFRDANSLPIAKLEESCELRGTAYVPEQIYKYCVCYPSNSFATRGENVYEQLTVCCVGCLLFSVVCGVTYQQTNMCLLL